MISASDLWRLDISGGKTTMDKVTESLLSEFSKEHEIESLKEDKQFEHFATYIVVRGEHTESFNTNDLVVGHDELSTGGADIGIDGIAITKSRRQLKLCRQFIARAANSDGEVLYANCFTLLLESGLMTRH